MLSHGAGVHELEVRDQSVTQPYEIATIEYPGAKGLNPLSLWDLYWVKELDDNGFSDQLVDSLQRRA